LQIALAWEALTLLELTIDDRRFYLQGHIFTGPTDFGWPEERCFRSHIHYAPIWSDRISNIDHHNKTPKYLYIYNNYVFCNKCYNTIFTVCFHALFGTANKLHLVNFVNWNRRIARTPLAKRRIAARLHPTAGGSRPAHGKY
jgi:hypothetical protein